MKKLITLEVIGLSTMSTWDEQGPNPTWHVFGSYESIRVGFQVLSSDYCYFWVLGTYKVLLDLKFFFFKIRFSKLCHRENLQKPWENKEAQNNMKKKKASPTRDPRNNPIMDPNIWVGSSFCLLNPIVIKSACWCLWTQPDPKWCIISAFRVLNNFFLNFLIILSIKILTIVIQLILIKNNRHA